jgi:hypothetical protein
MNELEKRKAKLNAEFDETLDHLRREKIWLNCAGMETNEKWKEFDKRVERFKEVVRLRDQYERTLYIRKGQEALEKINKHG